MQLIFDNLIATMVGGVVLLMLLASHHRNQVSAAEASAYYMLNQQVMEFTGVLQRDLQNVSRALDIDMTDDEFHFRAQTELGDTTKHTITYKKEAAGTVYAADGSTVQVYQIHRFVDGLPSGASPATISDWSLVALNKDEATIADPADAAAIKVQMVILPPIDVGVHTTGTSMSGTQWQATFRPRMLRGELL